MKAISLLQPWATLVSIGAKRVETRSWRTDYRGPIAIHASASPAHISGLVVNETDEDRRIREALRAAGHQQMARETRRGDTVCISRIRWDVPLGAVVASDAIHADDVVVPRLSHPRGGTSVVPFRVEGFYDSAVPGDPGSGSSTGRARWRRHRTRSPT